MVSGVAGCSRPPVLLEHHALSSGVEPGVGSTYCSCHPFTRAYSPSHNFFFSLFFKIGFPWPSWNSLYRPVRPQTRRSNCLCLPHAGIKGAYHHCPAFHSFSWLKVPILGHGLAFAPGNSLLLYSGDHDNSSSSSPKERSVRLLSDPLRVIRGLRFSSS